MWPEITHFFSFIFSFQFTKCLHGNALFPYKYYILFADMDLQSCEHNGVKTFTYLKQIEVKSREKKHPPRLVFLPFLPPLKEERHSINLRSTLVVAMMQN